MKHWIGVLAAILIGTPAHAQSDPTSGAAFYPSCLAASDIVQGKRPATDSEDAAKQLRQASACFGAVTAIVKLAPLFKPEFAVCPPADVVADSKDAACEDDFIHHGLSKKSPGAASEQFPSDRGECPGRSVALP